MSTTTVDIGTPVPRPTPLPRPRTGDRMALYEGRVGRSFVAPAPPQWTTRTAVVGVCSDAADLEAELGDCLAGIDAGGGAVVSVSLATAAAMAPDSLIVEDRLAALVVFRTGGPDSRQKGVPA